MPGWVKILGAYVFLLFLATLDLWVYHDTRHILALASVVVLLLSIIFITLYLVYLKK